MVLEHVCWNNEEEPPSELEEQFILYEMKKIQVKISRLPNIQVKISRLPNKERVGQLEHHPGGKKRKHWRSTKAKTPPP